MKAYFLAIIVLCIVFVMNIFGIDGLYVQFPPYDIFMHILGGIGIGLAAFAFVSIHGKDIVHKRLAVILIVLVAGLIWEGFEAYYNIAGGPVGSLPYYLDTAKDLFDDVIGGSLIAWLMMR
ncbi:MAG: hypothetical protein NTZ38_00520 [Candidatus Taylorbacteria bacterium]|nr:hypothetical protein [Candidatus Taylorbacteria bacterium]